MNDILQNIIYSETVCFEKVFIEDPLFLELEDVLNCPDCTMYLSKIVIGIPEKDINNFFSRLSITLTHLRSILDNVDEVPTERLGGLVYRAEQLIESYNTYKQQITFPPRFKY